MCIAIFVEAGTELDYNTLQNCYDNNPDGCGMAWIDGEELKVYKTMSFDEFYTHYKAVVDEFNSPMLLHFRIRTHGTTDVFNCHPFVIDSGHVFIHNGMIRNAPDDPHKRKSDTQMFNEHVLQSLPEGWMDNHAIQELIEAYIGYSKLVVLNTQGDVQIYNESSGVWNKEHTVWYSNTSYQTKALTTYYQAPYYKSPYSYGSDWEDTDYYTDTRGQRNRWCDVQKKYRPIDAKGAWLDKTPQKVIDLHPKVDVEPSTEVEYDKCDYCDSYEPIDSLLYVEDRDGASVICKVCKADLEDAGYSFNVEEVYTVKLSELAEIVDGCCS